MTDKLELDAITGEYVEREYTADELEQRLKDQEKHALLEQAKQERIVVRQALLERLGITDEEAQLLLGGI
jgi:hypothetical protein